jgi:uncharacterized membrane protein YfcA
MMELLPLAFLFVVVLFASAVNTVAGAGSLLVLPALIFSGLDASSANATNRIGILIQTAAALFTYRRAGQHVGARELRLTFATMLGGAIGSFLATMLGNDQLRVAILIAMVLMLALSLLPKRKTAKKPSDAKPSLPEPTPAMYLGFFAIGIYGGFLQAGVGILAMLFLLHAFQVDAVVSNVVKSAATFGLTVVALAVFAARGEHIDAPRGLVLAAASILGGLFGARVAMRVSERAVRIAIVLAVLVSLIKLVGDSLMWRLPAW